MDIKKAVRSTQRAVLALNVNPSTPALSAGKATAMRQVIVSLFILTAFLGAAGAIPAMAADPVRYDGVAKAGGLNDTSWLSDGQFYNPSSNQVASMKLSFIPRGASNPTNASTIPIPAGETLFIADILGRLSLGEGHVGSITVEGDVHSWMRTFNKDGDKTFGQSLPQADSTNRYSPENNVIFPFSAPQNTNQDFRSNLILTNLGTSAGTFTVTSGNLTREYSIPAGVYKQINDLGGDLGAAPGWDSCTVSATQPFNAYMSTVDPKTGDPATVEGLINDSGGGSGLCITNGDCYDDDCVCPDCDDDPFCSNPHECVDNGFCFTATEGCVCADCFSHPECIDN